MMNLQKNVNALIKELKQFDYTLDSIDRQWNIIFLDKKKKWHHIRVTQYKDTFYIVLFDGDLATLEVSADKKVQVTSSRSMAYPSRDPEKVWDDLIISANKWLTIVKKDWIKTNKQVYESYPLNRRYGTVPSCIVRSFVSDIYRIDKELGKKQLN